MEAVLDLSEIAMKRRLENSVDLEISRSKRAFTNLTQDIVSKGADYVIRAMPLNNHIKNILIDVKKSFETKDFKQVLKTAVSSSIQEGLNILNLPKNVIRDVTTIKDIALKGGLREGICSAIDIVTSKYLKNNVFYNIIKDFINKTKDFVFSRGFKQKIDKGIVNLLNKADKYKEKCNEWFKYYDKLDFDNMNMIAKSLEHQKSKVASDSECIRQNNIIQNMTQFVNAKKDKLSRIQLQICNNL